MMSRLLRVSLFAAASLATAAVSARADVAPGAVVNKSNADQVKDLVSPGVMWCLQHGMAMKIVPYRKFEWNPAYKEATEKYAGQVKLSADGRSIESHVGGRVLHHRAHDRGEPLRGRARSPLPVDGTRQSRQ